MRSLEEKFVSNKLNLDCEDGKFPFLINERKFSSIILALLNMFSDIILKKYLIQYLMRKYKVEPLNLKD